MELDILNEKLSNLSFTAIDFETANEKRNSACSLGIVVVENGIISQKSNFLLKPKEFRFADINKRIHGISESDVINAPEFNEVWPSIFEYFERQILLAHNADFDIGVLNQTLELYHLKLPEFKFMCTQKLAQEAFPNLNSYKLSDVAAYLSVELEHHNSLSDAYAAAEIGIRSIPLLNMDKLKFSRFNELTYFIQKKGSAIQGDGFNFGFSNKNIDSKLLKPNLEILNKDNFFYNKRVVFTGDLKALSRQEAAIKIQSLGANINTAISKKTEIVIIGRNAGPSKIRKIVELQSLGINIKLMDEDEFLSFIGYYV